MKEREEGAKPVVLTRVDTKLTIICELLRFNPFTALAVGQLQNRFRSRCGCVLLCYLFLLGAIRWLSMLRTAF